MSAEERFWTKVDRSGECWMWTAAQDSQGYGRFWCVDRMVFAHRFAYELLVAPIPTGLVLDHLCRVKSCVNPAHLEPVTIAENVRRGFALIPRRMTCKQGHEVDGDNIKLRSNGQPRCRICANASSRDYRHRLVAQQTP